MDEAVDRGASVTAVAPRWCPLQHSSLRTPNTLYYYSYGVQRRLFQNNRIKTLQNDVAQHHGERTHWKQIFTDNWEDAGRSLRDGARPLITVCCWWQIKVDVWRYDVCLVVSKTSRESAALDQTGTSDAAVLLTPRHRRCFSTDATTKIWSYSQIVSIYTVCIQWVYILVFFLNVCVCILLAVSECWFWL